MPGDEHSWPSRRDRIEHTISLAGALALCPLVALCFPFLALALLIVAPMMVLAFQMVNHVVEYLDRPAASRRRAATIWSVRAAMMLLACVSTYVGVDLATRRLETRMEPAMNAANAYYQRVGSYPKGWSRPWTTRPGVPAGGGRTTTSDRNESSSRA